MRQTILCSAILLFAVLVNPSSGGQANRTATIVDTTDVASEVTGLNYLGGLVVFENSIGRVAFSVGPIDYSIPIDNLISIERQGKHHVCSYWWRGKEHSQTGKLCHGRFTGKSDFGDVEIDTRKIKSIKCNTASKPKKNKKTSSPDTGKKTSNTAVLVLGNGASLTANNLKRHDRYYSTQGYVWGGRHVSAHYNDFCFLRGESLARVEFTKIKRIEFRGEKAVSVTLKNGKKATGTVNAAGPPGTDVLGFTGVCDKGEFYISKKHVKAIRFGEPDLESASR